nr:(2Fe-2S)-binding protein [Corynebacterium lactis]
MNNLGDSSTIPAEYVRLLAEFPRFSADVIPHAGAAEWSVSEEAVRAGVEAGRQLFPMPEVEKDDRFQAQLWWWSMCGSLVGPSLGCVLSLGRGPEWDWDAWHCFSRDAYWVGFQAQRFRGIDAADEALLRAFGQELAHFLSPLADAVAVVGGIKAAPLWAVAADAVASAAVAAGNELMEPWKGALLGKHVVEGIAGVHHVPLPRFVDSCDGAVAPWDEQAAIAGEEPDFDVVTHLERSTCCMILHSPSADLCVSCPKRSREERYRLWGQY